MSNVNLNAFVRTVSHWRDRVSGVEQVEEGNEWNWNECKMSQSRQTYDLVLFDLMSQTPKSNGRRAIHVGSTLKPAFLAGTVSWGCYEAASRGQPTSNHRTYCNECHIFTISCRFPSACGTSRFAQWNWDLGEVITDWSRRLRASFANSQQWHAPLRRCKYQSISFGFGQLYQCFGFRFSLRTFPRFQADSTSERFPGWKLPNGTLAAQTVSQLYWEILRVWTHFHIFHCLIQWSKNQVMIANVSPSHLSYEDTLNTLKYANRAKNIRVSASQQLIQPDDHVSNPDVLEPFLLRILV